MNDETLPQKRYKATRRDLEHAVRMGDKRKAQKLTAQAVKLHAQLFGPVNSKIQKQE